MQFPFNNKGAYLTNVGKKKLAEFLANEPTIETIYTNAKGDQRRVTNVSLPCGCITRETVWFPEFKSDGSRDYDTPRAVIEGDEAQITYCDVKTGEHKVTGSNEWVKWCGSAVMMTPWIKGQESTTMDKYVETLRKVSQKPPRILTDDDGKAEWMSLKDGTTR